MWCGDPSPDDVAAITVTATTKSIVDRFASLPEVQRQGIIADALEATSGLKWLPLPGPQTQAYFSEADIMLYGGEAGGSKTDSGLGLAFNEHRNSLLCRRQYTDLNSMIKRALEINGTREGFNGAAPAKLRTPDGRTIELRQRGTKPEVIQRIMKRENRKPTFDLYNETWVGPLGTSSGMWPISMHYHKPDGSEGGDLFDEPGRYRVRITFEVPQGAPGDWHGRAQSQWATLWVIPPDEWMK